MKSIFNNLRIGRKILTIPILAIISLVSVGGFYGYYNKATLHSLEKANSATEILFQLRSQDTKLQESRGELLQAFSWKMGYVEDTKVQEKLDSSLELANEIGTELKNIRDSVLALGISTKEYDATMVKQGEYVASLKSTSDMVTIDVDTALIMLNDTFDRIEAIDVDISNLVSVSDSYNRSTVDSLTNALSSNFVKVMGMIVFQIIVLLVMGLAIGRAIAKPIVKLTAVMSDMSAGNTQVSIDGSERGDEVGDMAKAVLFFKDSLIENDRLAEEQKIQQKEELERAERVSSIVLDFEKKIAEVVETFSKTSDVMQKAAESLSVSVGTSEHVTGEVENASGLAISNVQTVAAAVQEMNSSIGEISSQINKTMQVVSDAVEQTEQASDRTEELAKSVEQIGNIVTLIQDIAEQTNLLALNATIEAARAGDAGKGFAVVASEVKELASQTSNATDQISGNISEVQSMSNSVTKAILTIRKSIDKVSEYSTTVASAIEEQSNVTNEISSNMQSTADGVSDISENMAEVVSAVARVKEVANDISGTSEDLSSHSGTLKSEVNDFCSKVNNT